MEEQRQKSEDLFFARVVGVGSIPTPTIMAKTLEEIYDIPTEDLTAEIPYRCLICGRDIGREAYYCGEPDCNSGIEIEDDEIC